MGGAAGLVCALVVAVLGVGCEGSGRGAGKHAGRAEPLPGPIVGGVEGATAQGAEAKAGAGPASAPEAATAKAATGGERGGLPVSDMLAGRLGAKRGEGALPAVVTPEPARASAPVASAKQAKKLEKEAKAEMELRAEKEASAEKEARGTGVGAHEKAGEKSVSAGAPVVERGGAMEAYVVRPSGAAIKVGSVEVRVGERSVRAPLWFVYPEIVPGAGGGGGGGGGGASNHVREWIGTAATWRAAKTAPKGASESGAMAGMWVAMVEGGSAEVVTIDGRVVGGASGDGAGLPRQTHPANSAFARDVLKSLRQSPLVRWRARLAAGEPLLTEHAPDSFADAAVEGLARGMERAWAGVLSRVSAANSELAERFAARLGGVVDIGDGVSIPIWPADVNSGATMDSLLADLIAAGEDRERLSAIAAGWLRSQPVGGAVVVDDAAAVDLKSGLTFPSVLLANLSEQPAAAMASRAETAEPELLRLEPMAAVFASVGAAGARNEEGMDARQRTGLEAVRKIGESRTTADVRVGEWRGKRAVVGEVVKIRPPGLDIGLEDGPLMSDWTQESFLGAALEATARGRMPMSAAAHGFVGRLKPADEKAAGAGRWTFVFEVARGGAGEKGAGGEDRAEFVLFFGPRAGGNGAALRVMSDGSLLEVRNGQAMPAGTAVVKRTGERVFYWVPVPAQAIEGGKVLRVGLVRIDERGRRSAWPRPMLPWQTEPGRIAVDLSSWGPGRE